MNYYNEIDPYCVEWLNNLILVGLIPDGEVDSRPIQQVQPSDLKGFTQCHFFCGIAGWSLALKLAEWPEDRQVWTGSCPCQPFSVAGKRKKEEDERHLWPEFYRLIAQSRPSVVFGEQVAAATDWLSGVRGDMEAVDYAFGATPIEAACAGAAQYRDRIWFVACGNDAVRMPEESGRDNTFGATAGRIESDGNAPERGTWGLSGDDVQRQSDGRVQRSRELCGASSREEDSVGELASGTSERRNRSAGVQGPPVRPFVETGRARDVLAGHIPRLEKRESQPSDDGAQRPTAERSPVGGLVRDPSNGWGEGWTESEFRSRGFTAAVASIRDGSQFIECPDGKWRRLPPPRVRWLGNGIPSRVAKLRAYGNAIVPQVAAEFIGAFMDSEGFLELL